MNSNKSESPEDTKDDDSSGAESPEQKKQEAKRRERQTFSGQGTEKHG